MQPGEQRKLIIWSDRCVGQNNNWRVLNLYALLVQSRYFSEINQKFLCSGHSFLPCDRDFALIEKKKNSKVPGDWKYIIAEARLNKPFFVIEMQQNDFKDFTPVEKSLIRNTKMKITEGMWMKVTSDDPTNVYLRSSHNILRSWSIFQIYGRKINLASLCNLPEIYTEVIPISEEKKKDLIDMCDYLPQEKKQFYQDLLNF